MRETGTGTRRGAGNGGTRGRQGGYSREPAPKGQSRPAYEAYEQPRQQRDYGQKPPSRRKLPVGVGALVVIIVVVTLIVVGGISIYSINAEKESYYAETITAGVRINGDDYSGWDVDRLNRHLKDQFQKKLDQIQIKVTWQDRTWSFGGEHLGATHDVDEIVSKAALLARIGSLEQRRAEAKSIRAEGRKFDVKLTLDPEALRAALAEQTADVAQQGHDASVVFNPGLVEFTIPKDIEDLKPSQADIDKMFLVNPEVPGKSVDVDMMVQKIMDALKESDKVELELVVNDFTPQVTEAGIRKGFHLVNAYRTQLKGSTKERNSNIALALSKFNGFILKPGETISFNETTGERTEANGYQPAPTISGDKSIVDDYGGGVCQASTTLYNAALMSGCEILDRGPHSFPSAYAMKAFDAMVNWPNADLQFKNVSEGNLYIKAYVKEPWVYVMIFGEPLKNGVARVTRESELIYEGPDPQVKIIIDTKGEYTDKLAEGEPYVRVKGQKEMRYKAYLIYWDASGNVIEKKALYEDRFKEITREEVYSKQPEPSEQHGNAEEPQG